MSIEKTKEFRAFALLLHLIAQIPQKLKTSTADGVGVLWKGCTNRKSFDFLTYMFELLHIIFRRHSRHRNRFTITSYLLLQKRQGFLVKSEELRGKK